jgi:hypothetical protein
VDALLDLWTERALRRDAAPPPARPPEVLVLSQPDYAAARRPQVSSTEQH